MGQQNLTQPTIEGCKIAVWTVHCAEVTVSAKGERITKPKEGFKTREVAGRSVMSQRRPCVLRMTPWHGNLRHSFTTEHSPTPLSRLRASHVLLEQHVHPAAVCLGSSNSAPRAECTASDTDLASGHEFHDLKGKVRKTPELPVYYMVHCRCIWSTCSDIRGLYALNGPHHSSYRPWLRFQKPGTTIGQRHGKPNAREERRCRDRFSRKALRGDDQPEQHDRKIDSPQSSR